MAFFNRKTTDAEPERPELLAAYKDGRRDERTRVEKDVSKASADPRATDAYNRGRRDERSRRRGSPVVAVVLLTIAVIGGGVIYLAAREGSFARGGQVVDQQLGAAADNTKSAAQGAVDSAGNALENAGSKLKQTAGAPAPAPTPAPAQTTP